MREPSDVRRQRILAVVRSRGAARVSDLASELEVSMVTVRRDVEELARAGKLRRGHGVARSVVPVEQAPRSAPEGGAVALVIPERHAYLNETMHGARTALEEAGMRVALHIAPQVTGAERPIVERRLLDPDRLRAARCRARRRPERLTKDQRPIGAARSFGGGLTGFEPATPLTQDVGAVSAAQMRCVQVSNDAPRRAMDTRSSDGECAQVDTDEVTGSASWPRHAALFSAIRSHSTLFTGMTLTSIRSVSLRR